MQQIFPKSILENSVYAHRKKFQTHSLVIYNLVVWFVIAGIVALPLIKVDTTAVIYGKTVIQNTDQTSSSIAFEGYVNHSEIGYIKNGMLLNFSVVNLSLNDWKNLSGTVTEIAAEPTIIDDVPLFKITCRFSEDFMTNKNSEALKLVENMKLKTAYRSEKQSLFSLFFSKKSLNQLN